ncbi:MAG: PilT/PilU family type 4a pilus ATPase [Nitrospinota bacterium]|nr:PilT/PilU family type 4a pilus ATPase [Nitrospinota bacterium]
MKQTELDYILTTMLESHTNVSDLNITVGRPLQVESNGLLKEVEIKPKLGNLTPFQTEEMALCLINSDKRLTETLLSKGSCDLSYILQGKARFRVNIFSQRSTYSIVMRKLEARIPSIAELKLPEVFNKMAEEKNGMIFVTGATGSGKSTTIAAILDQINRTKPVHVVTLEDPVEFVHNHVKSTFNQRELGTDFDTFANGLRAALRQAPKVILVGEMRDRESVEIGLAAAETGHLVLTTLHTINAGQTINRIIGMFDKDEETQIRTRLAETVRWIVCQRLVPKATAGRHAVFEIMGSNLRVKDSIINGEKPGKTYYEIINDGSASGWKTFDTSLVESFQAGQISEETALSFSSIRANVGRGIDGIKATRGQKTSDIDELQIDGEYETALKKGMKPIRKKKK